MIHLLILAVHLLSTIAKLARPGGAHAVVAESLMLKHQLLISSRSRRRAPKLNSFDRFILALGSLFVSPGRIPKLAVILKPRTLLRFHEALKKRKYRWLFSTGGHRRPCPWRIRKAAQKIRNSPPTPASVKASSTSTAAESRTPELAFGHSRVESSSTPQIAPGSRIPAQCRFRLGVSGGRKAHCQ